MITFTKYALFFGAVFVLFMGLAIFLLMETMGGSAGVVGWWRDYDDDIGQITVFKTKIGFWRGQKLYEVQGHWDHKTFYGGADGASPEAIVAQELPDEDLQIHLVYFDPGDTRTVTAVMLSRQPTDFHPYPVRKDGQQVSYPPPKGMIKPGMLEADLDDLPWQPYTQEDATPLDPYHPNKDSYDGTHISNGWPRTWCYKSDDSKLPELRVTVEKGRVTQVTGGAEDTGDASYAPAVEPADSSDSSDGGGTGWIRWLLTFVLGK